MDNRQCRGGESPYLGAILAAGSGTRMMTVGERYPKPLLPVCNKPLIQYQIEMMRELGIRDITILIGHRGYQITRVFGDGAQLGVRLHYVEQTKMLGIAHAVGHLESHIDRPFLLFLGDIFFVPRDLPGMFRLFEEQKGGGILATKEEHDPAAIRRNYSVTLSAAGYVTRVIEKPRHTTNRLKGVGLYLFDLSIFDAIRRTPRTAMRDEYEITDAIQVMIDDGYPVRAIDAVIDDINLTNPRDLLELNLRQLQGLAGDSLIGQGCQIHPHATITRSVIGSGVTIAHPIAVTNSVVLDNASVTDRVAIENAIVTPELVINCGQPAGEPESHA